MNSPQKQRKLNKKYYLKKIRYIFNKEKNCHKKLNKNFQVSVEQYNNINYKEFFNISDDVKKGF